MDKKTIYVAGPMRGYEHFNFEAFDAAATLLRAQGWTVINPAELDRLHYGFQCWPPEGWVVTKEMMGQMILRDLHAITDCCDAIYHLKGWEESTGSGVEHALGDFLGLELFYETNN